MAEIWGLQLLHAVGQMFLNPLTYWIVLLLMIAGARRVKSERVNFGIKIHNYFNEIRHTFLFTCFFGLLLSFLTITFGFVFTNDMMAVLVMITILLSITGSFHLLSPAYTLSITFFIFMLLPLLPTESIVFISSIEHLTKYQFITFALLIGILLVVEALLILRAREAHVYSKLALSERGAWLGEQRLKRVALIPFLLFLPTQNVTDISPLLPYFQLGDTAYVMTLFPFIIGSQLTARHEQVRKLQREIGTQKLLLSLLVLAVAVASYFYFYLSFFAIVLAVVGNEWITYRIRMANEHKVPFFAPSNKGIKVLATLPGSRAEELDIKPGEIISKVNGNKVTNTKQFYKQLQQSGAFFKLDIIDLNGEVRFIQSAFYEEDHHELGLLFPEAPYYKRHKKRYEQLKEL